ncbi:hypothetical protein L1887_29592 [Cichorium endivia]|nr:hypothetical protein L1887_29592 [Cichorium endivia]
MLAFLPIKLDLEYASWVGQNQVLHNINKSVDSDKIMLARQTGLTRSQVELFSIPTPMAAKFRTRELGIPILLFPTGTDEKCNGQVSNWFINARVWLWKPMVE